ncbi:MAG: SGNH/GDSL hydrolase family protein [Bacteroidales bacterium]|nr:SGNH/GDSL hydrolase family protein [Bacteroidales bacterium]
MKRIFFTSLLLLALISCSKQGGVSPREIVVDIYNSVTELSPWGDIPYDFCRNGYVGFATNAGDRSAAKASLSYNGKMSLKVSISPEATMLWCYSKGALFAKQSFIIPSIKEKKTASVEDDLSDMLFCCETVRVDSGDEVSTKAKPLTAGLMLNICDSEGFLTGKPVKRIIMNSDSTPIAGTLELSLPREAFNNIYGESQSISVECTGLGTNAVLVGTSYAPSQVGLTVVPCEFTGDILVEGDDFSFTVPIKTPIPLLAGYVNSITLDVCSASASSGRKKLRIGVLGDSISTFNGIIPAGYSAYYPRSDSDVTSWQSTYWGVLTTEYYNGELDVISSWSGSCVAPSSGKSLNSWFTYRCKDFINPDIIILHGGSNDCQSKNGIALGNYDYNSPMSALSLEANFRQSYIYVVRYLMANYPNARLLLVVGNRVSDSYGNAIVEIGIHYGLPIVDFRPDNISKFQNMLHPDKAGHAYMALKIFEKLAENEI